MASGNKKIDFSIIIAAYSGAETIQSTLQSVWSQSAISLKHEVVIVIDGPQKKIRQIAEAERMNFKNNDINITIKQLKKNVGRFEARLIAAKLAVSDQLLFLDDRVFLGKNFLPCLISINKKTALGNVIELSGGRTNPISRTLYLLRRRVYGNKWGQNFKDYYIGIQNFESSPKGTASLWVTKEAFLQACANLIKSTNSSNRYVNEDTKIMRLLVDGGDKIFRSSKLKVFYYPRVSFSESARHLFQRGPRFVDYYIQPGTRFFPLLILIIFITLGLSVAMIFQPTWLLFITGFLVISILLTAVHISRDLNEFATSIIGLPLIIFFFSAGALKGTLIKAKEWTVSR